MVPRDTNQVSTINRPRGSVNAQAVPGRIMLSLCRTTDRLPCNADTTFVSSRRSRNDPVKSTMAIIAVVIDMLLSSMFPSEFPKEVRIKRFYDIFVLLALFLNLEYTKTPRELFLAAYDCRLAHSTPYIPLPTTSVPQLWLIVGSCSCPQAKCKRSFRGSFFSLILYLPNIDQYCTPNSKRRDLC